MDISLEMRVINLLNNELSTRPQDTLVLVTHKPQLLSLVDRIVILSNQGIFMDGPRDQVLHQLQQNHLARTGGTASSTENKAS